VDVKHVRKDIQVSQKLQTRRSYRWQITTAHMYTKTGAAWCLLAQGPATLGLQTSLHFYMRLFTGLEP
jgi:hypothetical protein